MRKGITALAAGGILPFAFAPYDFTPIAIVSLTMIFWLWRAAPPTHAACFGACFGLGMFGHGVSWVQISIHQFGLPLYSFSISMTVIFVVILSVFPMLVGYLVQRLPARSDTVRLLLFMPSVWVLSEILRSWVLTGFPWLLIGYSQTDSWFAGYAPVVGAFGISFAVAIVAALLVFSIETDGRARLAAVCGIVCMAAGGYGFTLASWTTPIATPIEVALVQGAIPQEIKWQSEFRARTLDHYRELSEPHWGKTVMVWPETALPAFPDEIPEALADFTARAQASTTALLSGMPTGDRRHGPYFNSVVLLNDPTRHYDKHHLVPFGEYLPFDRWVRPILNFLAIPMSDFARGGAAQVPLEHGRLRIGVSICYEDAYATEVAKPVPRANILVNVSDDAWFGDSIAPHQHLQIARMRALETGRYLLRATNTGISAIIDERGGIVARSPQFESFVVTGNAELHEGSTPFIRGGRFVIPLLSALGLGLGVGWRRRVVSLT